MTGRKPTKTVLYRSELHDDFAGNGIKKAKIPSNFRYDRSHPVRRFFSFLLKYLFAVPFGGIVLLFTDFPRVKNKAVLKRVRKKGYCLYSNHVLPLDPLVHPLAITPTRKTTILASDETFSISPFVTSVVTSLGAIPLPKTPEMKEAFDKRLKRDIEAHHRILVYPEMHIWPYYNGIRPFLVQTMAIPVSLNVPVITATTTFQERRFRKKPKAVIYLDGPFYPDQLLGAKAQRDLYERVIETMRSRASIEGNYEYIHYEKVKENAD